MTYRDLARLRPHLRTLLEYLTCRQCGERRLCAYDFASDSWFCSEECHGVYSAARGRHP